MIQGLFDGGALPVLQRLTQFTEARHRVLADNIANLSTPYYKPRDLNVSDFQRTLQHAIDARRSSNNPDSGPVEPTDTRDVWFRPEGIEARPSPTHDNILFHDQNNRDLERTMKDLAENTLTHNLAIQLTRNQFDMLRLAIRERI